MTQEEKAKRYDEVLAKAEKELEVFGTDKCEGARQILCLFPELKESDGERIKTAILNHLKKMWGNCQDSVCGVNVEDAITWLEKQGEQKLADKVEQKFKVGDWIACEELNTAKILSINVDRYEVEFIDGNKGFPHIDYIDRNFHLWTIRYAKEGDVLVASDGSIFIFAGVVDCACKYYVALTTDNYVKINKEGGYWETSRAVHPATKKQCDTLEKAMADAGFTFDFEKKELKKNEQKPAWGEVDKDFMYDTLSNLTELKDRYGEGYGNVGKCIDWLKKTFFDYRNLIKDGLTIENERK